jgi:glycerophosphoryl diester phosphodiesterase
VPKQRSRLHADRSVPKLIAHRGAMAHAPENSIAAFDLALSNRVDGIEFDVRLTADGIPVIFHDDDISRITGQKGSISDYIFDMLKTFDYGKWFSESHKGTGLLCLDEILCMYAHKTILMIELKTGPPDKGFQAARRQLTEKTIQMIIEKVPENRLDSMYLLSFDLEALMIAHSLAPGLKYVLNLEYPCREAITNPGHPIHGYGLPLDQLDKTLVRLAHESGRKIMTYSCNTTQQVAAALDAGADIVLTDDPAGVSAFFSDMTREL